MAIDLHGEELTRAAEEGRWVWAPRFDPTCGEYGVFMTRGNRIDLGLPSSTITGMRIILNNSFAPMPVVGHTFASAQFIGRGPTEVAIQITGKGDYELSRIQEMVEETEANARFFKRIRGAGSVYLEDNDFLKLCGIEDGIVSSVDTQTDPQGTDLFRAHLAFSSDGHHTEGFNQELYTPAQHLTEVLRVLAGYLSATPTEEGGSYSSDEFLETLEAMVEGLASRAVAMGEEIAGDEEANEEAQTSGQFIGRPIRTNWPGEGLHESVNLRWERNNASREWLTPYLDEMIEVMQANVALLPRATFFRGERRGMFRNLRGTPGAEEDERRGEIGRISQWPPMLSDPEHPISRMISGTKDWWIAPQDIENSVRAFESSLREVAGRLYQEHFGRPEWAETFGDIGLADSARELTLHPTYADLDLPPHPTTGRVLDTEADYYFFNDGEEGLLNETGPETLNELDEQVQRMELSFQNLMNGQTWRETNMGRSRIATSRVNPDNGTLTPNAVPHAMDAGPGAWSDGIDPATSGDDVDSRALEGAPSVGGGPGNLQLGASTIADRVIQMSPIAISSLGGEQNEELVRNRVEMIRRTTQSLLPGTDPNRPLMLGPIDRAVVRADRSHSFARQTIRDIAEQAVVQNPEESLTMRRAFPTFKIYFIEEDVGVGRSLLPIGDSGVRATMYFDDLYNYNSVKSIRLVRSRKSPADLLVLELTNVTGLLERRIWEAPSEQPVEYYAPGLEETEFENPLKKLILKEGLKVMARLGYSNHPLKCGEKFIGEIVEISYNAECTDEMTVICQSYGSELVLEPKCGSDGQRVEFRDTPDMVHTLMCSPELVHFGRFNLNPNFNPGEARSQATGQDAGVWWEISIDDVLNQYRDLWCSMNTRWLLANNPADDNIYVPRVHDYLSWWDRLSNALGTNLQYAGDFERWLGGFISGRGLGGWRILYASLIPQLFWLGQAVDLIGMTAHWTSGWFSRTSFRLYGQTIWEALKEAELRHPGWVAHPRPYGTRMTLFFGVPSHRYWADEISSGEQQAIDIFRGQLRQVENRQENQALFPYGVLVPVVLGHLMSRSPATAVAGGAVLTGANFAMGHEMYRWYCDRLGRELGRASLSRAVGEHIGQTFGRFRPFRRYHLVDSEHHILMNNIRASDMGTFNAVSVAWADGIYTMKADDSIPDEETTVGQFQFPSCDNEDLARRYCIGLLQRHLKDVYKGEVLTIGMDIDPYDQVLLMDRRSGMYGAFDVQQVVDTFTAETGWITEITPDLIVGTNEWATASTSRLAWAQIMSIAGKYEKELWAIGGVGAAAGVGGVVTGAAPAVVAAGVAMAVGAALMYQGGYWIIRWTQDRQPIWVLPLILGERPFFAGLDGFRQDGIFSSVRGEIRASFDNVRQGWRAFHLAGIANDASIGIAQWLGGQSGN
jgi:hypothetical protein